MEYLRGGEGGKLSWQQIALGLLIFPLLGGVLGLFAAGRTSERMIGVYVLLGTAVAAALLIRSDRRAARRPDAQPDVLEGLVPADEIVETGDVHFALKAKPHGSVVVLELLVQNLFDAPRTFELQAELVSDADAAAPPLPPIELGVPGAGLSAVRVTIPLAATGQRREVAIAVVADTRGEGGRRVRFARRLTMWKPPPGWVKVATAAHGGAVGGLIHGFLKGSAAHSPATTLTVTVGPAAPAPPDARVRVKSQPIWAPGDATDATGLRAQVREFFYPAKPRANT
jgi:hypothetical protein